MHFGIQKQLQTQLAIEKMNSGLRYSSQSRIVNQLIALAYSCDFNQVLVIENIRDFTSPDGRNKMR